MLCDYFLSRIFEEDTYYNRVIPLYIGIPIIFFTLYGFLSRHLSIKRKNSRIIENIIESKQIEELATEFFKVTDNIQNESPRKSLNYHNFVKQYFNNEYAKRDIRVKVNKKKNVVKLIQKKGKYYDWKK